MIFIWCNEFDIFFPGYIALKLFMGVTEIKKASAYGMDKNANSKKGQ